jgi:phytoene dehydrogenase-like protein
MRVAVVGGGLTGLVSALLLAAGGHRVTLIEGRPRLGGVARPITFGGCTFCPGPQYVWGFGDGGPGHAILREAGVSVPMVAMDEDFEQLAVGDAPFRPVHRAAVPTALEDALDRLGRAGPVIARDAGFRRSGASMIRTIATAGELGVAERVELFLARDESVADLARRHSVEAGELRRILYSQGIFAESMADLSAVVFAAARRHLLQPMHVPQGGVAALIDALVEAVHARPEITVLLERHVRSTTSEAAGHRLDVDGHPLGPFDRVVACCSPGVVARITGRPLAFAPSYTVGVACLAVDLTPEAADALRYRNFTWYAGDDDVAFDAPGALPATINLVCPTLNGGAAGTRQAICAFVPVARRHDPRADTDLVRRSAALLSRITSGVEIVDGTFIGPAQWTAEFGAFDGAIFGRRLTAASLQRSALDGLPDGWTLAHSGAGIPGVLGCLQMADAAAREVCA